MTVASRCVQVGIVAGGLPCSRCDRVFRTPDDLRQHVALKHDARVAVTKRTALQFGWATALVGDASGARDLPSFPCDVCGLVFTSADTYDAHLGLLQPSTATVKCGACGRMFADQRGVDQHQNYCQALAKSSEAEATA